MACGSEQNDARDRPFRPLNIDPEDGSGSEPLSTTLHATAFESRDLKHTKEEASANRLQRKVLQVAQWQIREAEGSYEDPVWDEIMSPDEPLHTSGRVVLFNKPNKVTLPYGVLKLSTPYYWRVRYQADDDLWSEWSDETHFITSPFVVKPYLQNVSQSGIVVMWEDDLPDGYVEYGLDNSCEQKASGTTTETEANTFIHTVPIQGLLPESTYHYQVVQGSDSTWESTFRAAPHQDTPFTFAVWADSQTGPQPFETLLDTMVASKVDFAVGVGDMATDGGIYADVHNYHVGPLTKKSGGRLPWFQTWGSHDGKDRIVYDYVSLPDRGGTFSFNYGNSHFTLLSIHHLDEEHAEWLRNDLASPEAQNATFRFFFVHNPPYCILWLDGDPWLREHVVPLLEEYNVDFVFSGHTHDYERGYHNGVCYVVNGGGSWLDYHEPIVGHWDFLRERMVMDNEFVLISIDGGKLEYRAINDEGDIIDIIRIKR